jgi:hypothetical protein
MANFLRRRRQHPAGAVDFVTGVVGANIIAGPVGRHGRAENADPFLMMALCIAIMFLIAGINRRNDRVINFSLGIMAMTIGNYAITHGVDYVSDHFSSRTPTTPRRGG